MGLIWILSLTFWGTVSWFFDIDKYTLYLNYKPKYMRTFLNLFWPILLIGIFTFLIKICLHYRNKRILEMMNGELNRRFNRSKSKCNSLSLKRSSIFNGRSDREISFSFEKFFKLSFKLKLVLIILVYWFQWYLYYYF